MGVEMSLEGTTEKGSLLQVKPMEKASIKVTERDTDFLDEVLTEACIKFDADSIRQVESQMIQSVLTKTTSAARNIREIMIRKWTALCDDCPLCFSPTVLHRIFEKSLPQLYEICSLLCDQLLEIVAHCELQLIKLGSFGGAKTKGVANRNKAKLAIELRLEKAIAKVHETMQEFNEYVQQHSEEVCTAMSTGLFVSNAEIAHAQRHELSEADASEAENVKGEHIQRDSFIEHVTSSIIMWLDPSHIVEDGSYLQHTQALNNGNSGDESSSLSSRISLHAAKIVAFAPEKMVDESPKSQTESTSTFRLLTVETPTAIASLLEDRTKQLEGFIDEVHKYNQLPGLFTTMTNDSGTQLLELDVREHDRSDLYACRVVNLDGQEFRYGRYCRISPLVILLLLQLRVHKNGVSEHISETVHLVKEEGGWRSLSTHVLYTVCIPNAS